MIFFIPTSCAGSAGGWGFFRFCVGSEGREAGYLHGASEKEGCGGSGDCARFSSFFFWFQVTGQSMRRRGEPGEEAAEGAVGSRGGPWFFSFSTFFCSVLAPLHWFLPEDFGFSEFASVRQK
jgi:hypothetical protein